MTQHEGERLQKVLAQAGIGSRRRCEELIDAGSVRVNGEVAVERLLEPGQGQPVGRARDLDHGAGEGAAVAEGRDEPGHALATDRGRLGRAAVARRHGDGKHRRMGKPDPADLVADVAPLDGIAA